MGSRHACPLAVVIALGLALHAAVPRASGTRGGSPEAAEADPCLHPGTGRVAAPVLVAGAMTVLRRAGHDPSAYELELRAGERGGAPTLVFLPRPESHLYAVTVRPDDPCRMSWLWDPERFTPWQTAALEKAQRLLERSTLPPVGAQLADVTVVETADSVTVRLRHGDPGEPACQGSESQVTLRKDELVRPAGATAGAH